VVAGIFYPVILQVLAVALLALVVLGFGGFAVWLYIWMPLKMRSTMSNPMKPRLVPFEFGRDLILPHVEAFFDKYESRIEALGFQRLERFFLNPGNMELRTAVVLFENAEGHIAQLIGIIPTNSDAETQTDESLNNIYYEFATEFTDDTSVLTNTSQVLGCFPKDPTSLNISCLPNGSPETLYEIHKIAVEKRRGDRQLLKLSDSNPVGDFTERLVKSFDHPIRHGYFWRDSKSQQFHATLKGTFLMSWTNSPPFLGVRMKRNAERNQRLLAEWGISELLTRMEDEAASKLAEITHANLRRRWGNFRQALLNRCAELGFAPERLRLIPHSENVKLEPGKLTIIFDDETLSATDVRGIEDFEEHFIKVGRDGFVLPLAELLGSDRASGLLYIEVKQLDDWTPDEGKEEDATPPAYKISSERFQVEPLHVEIMGSEAPPKEKDCEGDSVD